jgi:hypothetical protein
LELDGQDLRPSPWDVRGAMLTALGWLRAARSRIELKIAEQYEVLARRAEERTSGAKS